MTHTSTEQPSIEAIIHDMRESWARTTHGTWGKGDTTHETVARGGRKKEYKIADFRHADDAQFCDLAHAFTPRLLAEIESLQNRVQELEASQAQRVPQGWRLVPEWPTVEMSVAGDDVYREDGPDVFSSNTIYTRMLAAAPQPPEAKASVSNGTFAAPVQMPEPAEFQVRIRPTWDAKHNWTIWEKCTPEAAADYERTPLLHEWEYEVRKLYTEQQVRELLANHGIQEQHMTWILAASHSQRLSSQRWASTSRAALWRATNEPPRKNPAR